MKLQTPALALTSTLTAAAAIALSAPVASAFTFETSAYADAVVEAQRPDAEAGYWNKVYNNDDAYRANNPEAALGGENWDYTMTHRGPSGRWKNDIGYSLGNKGWLTVEFTDNALVGDGDTESADLWIFEIGAVAEDMTVEISTDNETWYTAGLASRPNPEYDYGVGLDIDTLINAEADLTLDTLFRYVRVSDTGTNTYSNSKAGADIDAIAAISNREVSREVPEPTALLSLAALGLLGLPALGKRNKQAQ